MMACSTFEEHHGTVFQIVWELVARSEESLKTSAANLLKVLVCFSAQYRSLLPYKTYKFWMFYNSKEPNLMISKYW